MIIRNQTARSPSWWVESLSGIAKLYKVEECMGEKATTTDIKIAPVANSISLFPDDSESPVNWGQTLLEVKASDCDFSEITQRVIWLLGLNLGLNDIKSDSSSGIL